MLAEMIEKIANLAKSGVEAKSKFSVIPDLTGNGQYEIYPDGSVTHSEWPADRRTQRLLSISEISLWFDQFEAGPNRQICVSRSGVAGDIPVYRTKRTDVRIRGGQVMFNQHNPEQFHQPTLAFKDEVKPDTLEK